MMEYKGYIAAAEYDDLEEVLYGRVINAGSYPVATFEATDVQQLRKEFHHSVDEYLASCKEDDVEPRKPFSGKLQLQIPPDLHARVAESAVRDGMSIASWIEQALEELLPTAFPAEGREAARCGNAANTNTGFGAPPC